MRPERLDEIDRQLLSALQRDAEVNRAELAREVGLSPAGLHKRLARLKSQGYFQRTVALLNRRSLGLDLLAFMLVTFRSNLRFENQDALRRAVADIPQVLECYTLTGTSDAILKILVRDQSELRDLLQTLAQAQDVIDRIQTCVVLEEFKNGPELPLPPSETKPAGEEPE
ncbi:Lrp/AsnC family transcriptional regulator (plasmid) [Deinococcus psychrotolerans]|uniref:Lrp/AsnC family transcriptional regulator n=1 Tax=Deinococcus psychrotolerans TaxID=2489213 RepID=A0A3G8YQN3_9DEIO|nr:Lrp/AsnC family transcriptional regulator [Deinococcus psychrotolerans]AZI44894.1 Lrp/AsnC family transcriptional regulator [Deinococcus psychrotolerans]